MLDQDLEISGGVDLPLPQIFRLFGPQLSPKIGGNNETNRGYAHSTVEDANTRPRLSTSLLKLVRALGFKNSPTFDKMERRGMRVMKF